MNNYRYEERMEHYNSHVSYPNAPNSYIPPPNTCQFEPSGRPGFCDVTFREQPPQYASPTGYFPRAPPPHSFPNHLQPYENYGPPSFENPANISSNEPPPMPLIERAERENFVPDYNYMNDGSIYQESVTLPSRMHYEGPPTVNFSTSVPPPGLKNHVNVSSNEPPPLHRESEGGNFMHSYNYINEDSVYQDSVTLPPPEHYKGPPIANISTSVPSPGFEHRISVSSDKPPSMPSLKRSQGRNFVPPYNGMNDDSVHQESVTLPPPMHYEESLPVNISTSVPPPGFENCDSVSSGKPPSIPLLERSQGGNFEPHYNYKHDDSVYQESVRLPPPILHKERPPTDNFITSVPHPVFENNASVSMDEPPSMPLVEGSPGGNFIPPFNYGSEASVHQEFVNLPPQKHHERPPDINFINSEPPVDPMVESGHCGSTSFVNSVDIPSMDVPPPITLHEGSAANFRKCGNATPIEDQLDVHMASHEQHFTLPEEYDPHIPPPMSHVDVSLDNSVNHPVNNGIAQSQGHDIGQDFPYPPPSQSINTNFSTQEKDGEFVKKNSVYNDEVENFIKTHSKYNNEVEAFIKMNSKYISVKKNTYNSTNRSHSGSRGRSSSKSPDRYASSSRSHSQSPPRKRSMSQSPSRRLLRKKRSHSRTESPDRFSGNSKREKSKERSMSSSKDKSSKKSVGAVTSNSSKMYEGRKVREVEKGPTERETLLEKYRKDYCSDLSEVNTKMNELKPEELIQKEAQCWIRMSPAELYYKSGKDNSVYGTTKLDDLCNIFKDVLVERAERIRSTQPKYELPARRKKMKIAKHKSERCSSSSSNSDSSTSSSDEEDCTMEELERKRNHPYRLHPELWFNDVGEMNDGPLCRCSAKARRSGIRHNIYAGELNLPKCEMNSNNANTLHHYRITISPPTNFLIKTPTIISHDDHEFIFEGFSMFSHGRLDKLPVCKVIRFNIEYTILYFEEKMPHNFTIKELDLFYDYLFKEILELVDLDFRAGGDTTRCAQFHFMPRFVRELPESGKEILSMSEVLKYLLNNSDDLVKESELEGIQEVPQYIWQRQVDMVKGMVVTIPGMKPCSVRIDQLDRDKVKGKTSLYPEIVHFGIRPPQLSYAGNPEYQKAWREYVKFRHLLANMPKPSFEDKRKLEVKENRLQEMRTQSKMKRDVTVTVNSNGFMKTGIMCDIVQHAMLIPVLVSHLRFHRSLDVLEEAIKYKFTNRFLLQLALTHPSYRENFGTNPDHARNSLTNCGIRQPEYGDRRIHYMNTRKRGINTLINIMSRFGKKTETESNITHNERLEFLGDAVVEFITSIHLFHMFPDLEEGGLATYRAAIVQNQHLAVLARTLKLDEYMLYAHGSDLCHDLELRHAMANCFEALMGALFLDGGISVADKVFGETLFKSEPDLLDVWVNYPLHPLQDQEPLGDRKWIPHFQLLQKLTKFEESIGVEFTHIRLLARAFTDRSIGYTNLTLGSNQRLEFLGDTVLQLIASEYLYKYFPEHHEGHLSLLRSSLVNNRTQSVVCNDLGMTKYALYSNPKAELKTKDRADLLEAFLGALYVDKDLEYCEVFCNVCFFPRLQAFIMRQDWNDPKSKLQQCCLTLRTMEGGEPEIPVYKVIQCMGPTNTRIYTVAVYFKGSRLAKANGHSIQQAEMNAAKKALRRSHKLFPQLDHQKRVIAKSLKSQRFFRPQYDGHMQRMYTVGKKLLSNRNNYNYFNNHNFNRGNIVIYKGGRDKQSLTHNNKPTAVKTKEGTVVNKEVESQSFIAKDRPIKKHKRCKN